MPSTEANGPAITVEISPGELLDKISILEIKSDRIGDAEKLANIRYELKYLRDTVPGQFAANPALAELMRDLKTVNEELWDIEDEIRDCESRKDFGETFVRLARSVYRTNDRRAAIKRKINTLCGSAIVEEKSYTQY